MSLQYAANKSPNCRGLLAASTLLEMGFANVKSMAGGFSVWQQEGREIAGVN